MYFGNDKQNTNIDKDFKKETNFDLSVITNLFRNKLVLIGLSVIVVIIIAIIIFSNKKDDINYIIEMDTNSITIYQDSISKYENPHCTVFDMSGKQYEPIIDNPVNLAVPGEYTVTCSRENTKREKKVTVIEGENNKTKLLLKGNKIIQLKVGEKYTEPGYDVIDPHDANLKDKVTINGKVDINKVGTYKIEYTVINSSGVTVSNTRTVIVSS